jgi:hypothetical protein
MNENATDQTGKGHARRRLLRGAFAAPAVLTMVSGGALAATSATCVAKAQTAPQTGPVVPDASADTFLRVQLYQTGNDATLVHWLSGDSISTFSGFANIVQAGKYTRFLIGSNTLSVAASEVNQNPASPVLSSPATWVALRFDGTGTLVGVGATGGGSAITASCWTSTH